MNTNTTFKTGLTVSYQYSKRWTRTGVVVELYEAKQRARVFWQSEVYHSEDPASEFNGKTNKLNVRTWVAFTRLAVKGGAQ